MCKQNRIFFVCSYRCYVCDDGCNNNNCRQLQKKKRQENVKESNIE